MKMLLALFICLVFTPEASSEEVQVDLSRFPNGTTVPPNVAIADEWRDLGILFAARRINEPVGQQGTVQSMAMGNGLDCSRYYFFQPDVFGAVGIFRFVAPGTKTEVDVSHFEMVAGWDGNESISLIGFDHTGSIAAQKTFNPPAGCVCNALIELTGHFRYVEVRTQGNPGIGFPNCGLQGGYGLRFTLLQCGEDVNGDSLINVDDLLAVITDWGPCPAPPTPCPANIVVTGMSAAQVDVDDLLAVITAWGQCP